MIDQEAYNFKLPPERIAQRPAQPAGSSRLLYVPRRGSLKKTNVNNLLDFLPANSLLIANNTRVVKARLLGSRITGGSVEALLIGQKVSGQWHALTQGRLKSGEEFYLANKKVTFVCRNRDGISVIDFGDLNVKQLMEEKGKIPLPPYIHREAESEDSNWYQTSFARHEGSVAAPTAGLHFTPDLIDRIKQAGHSFMTLTLHIGPGTFSPVRVANPFEHRVMPELAQVDKKLLQKIKEHKKQRYPIVAIGTTVVRTLETIARRQAKDFFEDQVSVTISPPFKFRLIDHLLTNFHLPRSSLMMLVCSFAGRKRVLGAYQEAIESNYNFYSYGDLSFFE